jgi:hypothetical protein
MASPTGRILRIVAGIGLIFVGLFMVVDQVVSIVLAAVGVVFVLVGVFNVCLLAPIIGAPFSGREALKR